MKSTRLSTCVKQPTHFSLMAVKQRPDESSPAKHNGLTMTDSSGRSNEEQQHEQQQQQQQRIWATRSVLVTPLFPTHPKPPEQDERWSSLPCWSDCPQRQSIQDGLRHHHQHDDDDDDRKGMASLCPFQRKALVRHGSASYCVVAAMSLCRHGVDKDDQQPQDTAHSSFSSTEEDLLTEAYTVLQDDDDDDKDGSANATTTSPVTPLTWQQWLQLYTKVRTRLVWTTMPHPLTLYAETVLPNLTVPQLQEVASIVDPQYLQQQDNEGSTLVNETKVDCLFLHLRHKLSETAALPIAVYPHENVETGRLDNSHVDSDKLLPSPQHSCVPTAVWEYNADDCTLSLLTTTLPAIHNNKTTTATTETCPLTVSAIDTTTMNGENHNNDILLSERTLALQERFGPSFVCHCPLCTVQRHSGNGSTNVWNTLSTTDLIRLGHAAMGQRQDYTEALQWYRQALARDDSLVDVQYSIGAVYLNQGKFLRAHRHWAQQDCVATSTTTTHVPMTTQVEKHRAYCTIQENDNNEDTTNESQPQQTCRSDVPFDTYCHNQCFQTTTAATVVSRDDCRRIIEWAKAANGWTTHRHYAVPTNDVPVHTVPSLLQWFRPWFRHTVRPLLGRQFGNDGRYYHVHDAFVVRYTGCDDWKDNEKESGREASSSSFLPIHVDESTHSFVLALNQDFEGGGTYFRDYRLCLAPREPGTLVAFRGDSLWHGGNRVTAGVRYILTGFLFYDDNDDDGTNSSKETKRRPSSETSPDDKQKRPKFTFGFALDDE